MASSFNRTILLVATALTGVGCQSGAVTKAMNPSSSRTAALLRAQGEAQFAASQDPRLAAVAAAEHRVATAPDDLEARRSLAQQYFAAGRFQSAVQAFDDALAIAPADDGLRLRKALALLAGGNQVAAKGELGRVTHLPDAGLAYALAGDPDRGVALLIEAARRPDATARIRQNLALAHALGGEWARARVVAAQDLDAATLETRVRQWAELATRGDVAVLTAGLLGIAPSPADAGRPVALAYVPPEARIQQAAAPAPAAEASPKVEVAAAAPRVDMAAATVPIAVTPVAKPAPARTAPAARPAVSSTRAAMVRPAAAASGRWVVQLAAYDKPELLEANWKHIATRNADLVGDYSAVRSQVTIGSRRFYRLALAGFDARAEAVDLCEGLRAKGRACFVRNAEPAPERTAAVRRDPKAG